MYAIFSFDAPLSCIFHYLANTKHLCHLDSTFFKYVEGFFGDFIVKHIAFKLVKLMLEGGRDRKSINDF